MKPNGKLWLVNLDIAEKEQWKAESITGGEIVRFPLFQMKIDRAERGRKGGLKEPKRVCEGKRW